MISYTFYLNYPKREKSGVMMALRSGGKRLTLSTGVEDLTAAWNQEQSQFEKTAINPVVSNELLRRFASAATKAIQNAIILDSDDLFDVRNDILQQMGKSGSNRPNSALFLPYYLDFVSTETTERKVNRHRYYHYKLFKEYLAGREVKFKDLNVSLCEGFIEWMNKRGLNANTRGIAVKTLKAAVNDAYKRGLHNNEDFRNFRQEKEEVDTVYLTNEELERIWCLNLVGSKEMSRDLFLIGCYTALRWSDYSRLTPLNVTGNHLKVITQKTKERVVIPIHPRVRYILEKWNGSPKISQQNFNSNIKLICQQAQIDNIITILQNGKEVKREKWELVSSHTARRTAATNMFKAGIPAISIMKITGHRTESSFMSYIRISKEENADLLMNNKFFQTELI